MVKVVAPISVGELVDKITILELKVQAQPLGAAATELAALRDVATEAGIDMTTSSCAELREVNRALWQAEDRIRAWGNQTAAIARMITVLNDRRAQIKQTIDQVAGSEFTEVKVYAGS